MMQAVKVGKRGYAVIDRCLWGRELAVGQGDEQRRVKTYHRLAYLFHRLIGRHVGWTDLEKLQLNLDQVVYVSRNGVDRLNRAGARVGAAALQQQLDEWRQALVQRRGTVWGWDRRRQAPYRIKDEGGVAVERLFQPERELGRGGYGKVHLLVSGSGPQRRRKVLKEAALSYFFRQNRPNHQTYAVNALQREWQCTQALRGHTGVMTGSKYIKEIKKGGIHQGMLVLSHCRGSLFDIVEDLLPALRRAAVHELALGLQAVHQGGWVHRDIKLDNLLYRFKQGRWHFEISDFGCAKDQGGYDAWQDDYRRDVLTLAIAAKQILLGSTRGYNSNALTADQVAGFAIDDALAQAINDALGRCDEVGCPTDDCDLLLQNIIDASAADPADA